MVFLSVIAIGLFLLGYIALVIWTSNRIQDWCHENGWPSVAAPSTWAIFWFLVVPIALALEICT